jgi:hypothetical protein
MAYRSRHLFIILGAVLLSREIAVDEHVKM